LTGIFVQLERLPDAGVPNTGETSVGLVESTTFPEPVEVVTPVPPLSTGKVPVAFATGILVQFVSTPDVGVPSIGVTKVGLVESTLLPDPVEVVTPVPPLATAKVPARVIAPEVAVFGVRPVVPPLNVVTVAPDADDIFTKSDPFQAQIAFSLAAIVTPVVGPTPRNTIDCVPLALITT
jgi:hypothetical protein